MKSGFLREDNDTFLQGTQGAQLLLYCSTNFPPFLIPFTSIMHNL